MCWSNHDGYQVEYASETCKKAVQITKCLLAVGQFAARFGRIFGVNITDELENAKSFLTALVGDTAASSIQTYGSHLGDSLQTSVDMRRQMESMKGDKSTTKSLESGDVQELTGKKLADMWRLVDPQDIDRADRDAGIAQLFPTTIHVAGGIKTKWFCQLHHDLATRSPSAPSTSLSAGTVNTSPTSTDPSSGDQPKYVRSHAWIREGILIAQKANERHKMQQKLVPVCFHFFFFEFSNPYYS